MNLTEIHDTLMSMNGEIMFSLKQGTITHVLLGDDDREKIELFTYLLGEITYNEIIEDATKIDLVGMVTLGLNIVLHGEL